MRPIITLGVCTVLLLIIFVLYRIKRRTSKWLGSEFWTKFFHGFHNLAEFLTLLLILVGMLSTFESVYIKEGVYILLGIQLQIQNWVVAYALSFLYLVVIIAAFRSIVEQ